MDCSEAEDFYNINEKIGSEDPIATDDNLASKSPNRQQASQTNQRRQRPQNQPQQPQTRPQQGQGRRQQMPQASKPSRGKYFSVYFENVSRCLLEGKSRLGTDRRRGFVYLLFWRNDPKQQLK